MAPIPKSTTDALQITSTAVSLGILILAGLGLKDWWYSSALCKYYESECAQLAMQLQQRSDSRVLDASHENDWIVYNRTCILWRVQYITCLLYTSDAADD